MSEKISRLVSSGGLVVGAALTPLSRPLPFFAYPFLVATLVGWAWEPYRGTE